MNRMVETINNNNINNTCTLNDELIAVSKCTEDTFLGTNKSANNLTQLGEKFHVDKLIRMGSVLFVVI